MTIYIDFETYPIETLPDYPPEPVGVSIAYDDAEPQYYAFGHPTGNNSPMYDTAMRLYEILKGDEDLVFHNAKFDIAVMWKFIKEIIPLVEDEGYTFKRVFRPERIHDTMLLLFLYDPDSPDLSLKTTSERLLDIPPTEQKGLAEWLVENQPVEGVKITSKDSGKNTFCKYIYAAPADIVGKYANGDIYRTRELFKFLFPGGNVRVKNKNICCSALNDAYLREKKLMLILMDMEKRGIQINFPFLKQAKESLSSALKNATYWLTQKLNVEQDFKFNSSGKLLEALENSNLIDHSKIVLTKTGRKKADKASLQMYITDKQVANMLVYRNQIQTLLNTFIANWLKTAEKTGKVFPAWFQVKSDKHGARTGRLSSSPNFQNIPTEFPALFSDDEDSELPPPPIAIIKMPNIRSFIIPYVNVDTIREQHVLISMDWRQQELRLLAHFENDALMRAYQKDEDLDVHTHAQEMIRDLTGITYDRKIVKNVAFGLLYGMGVNKLAATSGVEAFEAKQIQDAYFASLPGIDKLKHMLKMRAKSNEPFRTWGGRFYYCEPPKGDRTYDYKMINTLIQGSAADCLKEAMIRYYETKPDNHYLVLNVHDEILISVPLKEIDKGIEILKNAMEGLKLDVKLLTDVEKWGKQWG